MTAVARSLPLAVSLLAIIAVLVLASACGAGTETDRPGVDARCTDTDPRDQHTNPLHPPGSRRGHGGTQG
jgi:hypothetical protein